MKSSAKELIKGIAVFVWVLGLYAVSCGPIVLDTSPGPGYAALVLPYLLLPFVVMACYNRWFR